MTHIQACSVLRLTRSSSRVYTVEARVETGTHRSYVESTTMSAGIYLQMSTVEAKNVNKGLKSSFSWQG